MNTTTMKRIYTATLTGLSSFLVVGTLGYAAVGPQEPVSAPAQVQAEKPNAEGSPVDLMERKCRPYAEGTIPGHAVVTLPGQDPAYVASQVGFDLWGPDQEFGTADDLDGTLHAFCR